MGSRAGDTAGIDRAPGLIVLEASMVYVSSTGMYGVRYKEADGSQGHLHGSRAENGTMGDRTDGTTGPGIPWTAKEE